MVPIQETGILKMGYQNISAIIVRMKSEPIVFEIDLSDVD